MTNAHSVLTAPALVRDVVMASLLSLMAVGAFQQSFGGSRYLIVGACGILIGVGTSLLGEIRKLPVIAIVATALIGYVLIGGVLALPDQAVLGVLPSRVTIEMALRQVTVGWKQLLTTVPPVSGVGGLLNLPVFCGVFAAAGSITLARRLRWLVVSVTCPFSVMVVGLLCGFHQPVSVAVHGSAFVVVVVLWWSLRARGDRTIEQRGRRRGGRHIAGVGMLVAAGVVGMAVGPSLSRVNAVDRVVLRDRVDPPFDPANYPSPLSAHRRYIKGEPGTELFTVTGLPKGATIRTATMDRYDGILWKLSSGATASTGTSGFFQRVGSDVDPTAVGTRYEITVAINEWSEVWVPTVGDLVSIRFDGQRAKALTDAFRYNRVTGTAALQGMRLQQGDQYTMVVVLPQAGEPPAGSQIEQTTSDIVKMGSSEKLSTFLNRVSQVERSRRPYELAKTLRQVGLYSDGNTDQEPSIGGHGLARLQAFIEGTGQQPIGDAEQYAAGLAVMLNLDGIGARVVAGFRPTTSDRTGGDKITITGANASAWVETPYAGRGWYVQDPTPPAGQTKPKNDVPPPPQPERNVQVPPPPPLLTEDSQTQPALATKNDRAAADQKAIRNAAAVTGGHSMVAVVVAIGSTPVLVAVSMIGLIASLKSFRRIRRRRRGTPITRILNGWREFTDSLRDLGMPVSANSTRREVACLMPVGDASELARHADYAVFSPDQQSDDDASLYWGALDFELRRLRRELGLGSRLKLLANVTSLRSRGTT